MKSARQRRKSYRFGLHAERLACWYLRAKGYRIYAERYRNHQGEIDILAGKGRLLVAVEVKARNSMQACEASITPWKQRKIMSAMQGLLSGQGRISGLADLPQRDIRFDVIWIVPWQWPRHLKDAWRD